MLVWCLCLFPFVRIVMQNLLGTAATFRIGMIGTINSQEIELQDSSERRNEKLLNNVQLLRELQFKFHRIAADPRNHLGGFFEDWLDSTVREGMQALRRMADEGITEAPEGTLTTTEVIRFIRTFVATICFDLEIDEHQVVYDPQAEFEKLVQKKRQEEETAAKAASGDGPNVAADSNSPSTSVSKGGKSPKARSRVTNGLILQEYVEQLVLTRLDALNALDLLVPRDLLEADATWLEYMKQQFVPKTDEGTKSLDHGIGVVSGLSRESSPVRSPGALAARAAMVSAKAASREWAIKNGRAQSAGTSTVASPASASFDTSEAKSLADVGVTPQWTFVEPDAVRLLLRWYNLRCERGHKRVTLEVLHEFIEGSNFEQEQLHQNGDSPVLDDKARAKQVKKIAEAAARRKDFQAVDAVALLRQLVLHRNCSSESYRNDRFDVVRSSGTSSTDSGTSADDDMSPSKSARSALQQLSANLLHVVDATTPPNGIRAQSHDDADGVEEPERQGVMAFPMAIASCLPAPFQRATSLLSMLENRTRTNKRGVQSSTRCLRFLMRSIRAVYVEARDACNLDVDVEDGILDAEAAAEISLRERTASVGCTEVTGSDEHELEQALAVAAAEAASQVARKTREPVRLDAESFFPIFVSVVRRSGLRFPSRLGWLLENFGVGMRKHVGEVEYYLCTFVAAVSFTVRSIPAEDGYQVADESQQDSRPDVNTPGAHLHKALSRSRSSTQGSASMTPAAAAAGANVQSLEEFFAGFELVEDESVDQLIAGDDDEMGSSIELPASLRAMREAPTDEFVDAETHDGHLSPHASSASNHEAMQLQPQEVNEAEEVAPVQHAPLIRARSNSAWDNEDVAVDVEAEDEDDDVSSSNGTLNIGDEGEMSDDGIVHESLSTLLGVGEPVPAPALDVDDGRGDGGCPDGSTDTESEFDDDFDPQLLTPTSRQVVDTEHDVTANFETTMNGPEKAEAERGAAELAEAEQLAAAKAEAERVAANEAEAERLASEKAEAERFAAENDEAKRVAAEQAEAERFAAEKAEAERVAAAEAEAERLAAEKAEAERVAAEEAERLAAEEAEAERIAAAEAEAERVAAEKAEAERIAAAEAEAERVAAEEAERLAAEKAEAERVAAEQAEAEREAERVAAEEAERLAAEKAEAERVAAEQAEAERVAAEEAERLAAEEAEAERIAAAEAEAERVAADERVAAEEAERLAAEKAEAERVAAEQAEAERVAAEEAERLAAEEAEAERIAAAEAEAERVAAEKAEAERIAAEEAERLAAEKAEAERVAAEQAEAERVAAEEAERLAAEEAEAERIAAAEAEAERVAAEKAEAERVAAEEAERLAAEEAEAERIAAAEAEAERVAAEKAEAERVAAEEAERLAAEEAEAERIAAAEAEAERVAAEKAEAERVAAEEAERLAAEEAEAERIAAAEAEAERVAAEKAEAERVAAEEAERLAAEEAEAERVAAQEAEAERVAAAKAEAERVAAEKAEAKRVAAEEAEAERLAAEKAEAERVAAEDAEAERVAAEKAEERVAAEKAKAERISAEEAESAHVEVQSTEPSTVVETGEDTEAQLTKAEESVDEDEPSLEALLAMGDDNTDVDDADASSLLMMLEEEADQDDALLPDNIL